MTVVYEYEVENEWFEGCSTSEEVLAQELENLKDGGYLSEHLMYHEIVEMRVEIIKE